MCRNEYVKVVTIELQVCGFFFRCALSSLHSFTCVKCVILLEYNFNDRWEFGAADSPHGVVPHLSCIRSDNYHCRKLYGRRMKCPFWVLLHSGFFSLYFVCSARCFLCAVLNKSGIDPKAWTFWFWKWIRSNVTIYFCNENRTNNLSTIDIFYKHISNAKLRTHTLDSRTERYQKNIDLRLVERDKTWWDFALLLAVSNTVKLNCFVNLWAFCLFVFRRSPSENTFHCEVWLTSRFLCECLSK